MEQKKFKEMVSALEKVAGENKRVTENYLEKLNIVSDTLLTIIRDNDLDDNLKRFDFGGYGFRTVRSNIGSWTEIFSVDEQGDYCSNILPGSTKNIGCHFYLHNDFNCGMNYMTRGEILGFSKILPDFIQNMITKIEKLTENEKEKMEKLVVEND